MVSIKLNSEEHAALCSLVLERVREYEQILAIENSKLHEESSMFNNVILGASRKAKTFILAYQSLYDTLKRFEVVEDKVVDKKGK